MLLVILYLAWHTLPSFEAARSFKIHPPLLREGNLASRFDSLNGACGASPTKLIHRHHANPQSSTSLASGNPVAVPPCLACGLVSLPSPFGKVDFAEQKTDEVYKNKAKPHPPQAVPLPQRGRSRYLAPLRYPKGKVKVPLSRLRARSARGRKVHRTFLWTLAPLRYPKGKVKKVRLAHR